MLPETAFAVTMNSEVATASVWGQPSNNRIGTSRNPPPAPMIVPNVPSPTPRIRKPSKPRMSTPLKGLQRLEGFRKGHAEALAALAVHAFHPVEAGRLRELA